eukprot:11328919-Ditylum_brightwellii.AAC.1
MKEKVKAILIENIQTNVTAAFKAIQANLISKLSDVQIPVMNKSVNKDENKDYEVITRNL